MNARWINAEITTCADRAVNRPRGQSPVWEGHILIVCDRFLILPRGRRNASRTRTRQLTRLGARRVALRRPRDHLSIHVSGRAASNRTCSDFCVYPPRVHLLSICHFIIFLGSFLSCWQLANMKHLPDAGLMLGNG